MPFFQKNHYFPYYSDKSDVDMSTDSHEELETTHESPSEDQAAQLEQKYMRLLADLENMQRRHQEDILKRTRHGARSVLEALLPALDSLDMARMVPDDLKDHPWIQGFYQFERQLTKILMDLGVTTIEISIGETVFDPRLHDAIGSTEATDSLQPGTVSRVYQQGYLYQGDPLRTATVEVVKD